MSSDHLQPTPDKLRVLKGNGKDRDPAGRKVRRQPKTAPAIPPLPAGLGPDGERMWQHVTPELARMGILGQVDLGALESYCLLYERVHNYEGDRGFPALVTAFLNAGSKLGLDPASRLRMTLPEADDGAQDDIYGASAV